MTKMWKKDWILFEEVANEKGDVPKDLKLVDIKEGNPDEIKHVPFIEEKKDGYLVKMGKTGPHSNDVEHHTIFIELIVDDTWSYRKYFKRDEISEAYFKVPKGKKVVARSFCNLHGLWKYSL